MVYFLFTYRFTSINTSVFIRPFLLIFGKNKSKAKSMKFNELTPAGPKCLSNLFITRGWNHKEVPLKRKEGKVGKGRRKIPKRTCVVPIIELFLRIKFIYS